MGSEQQFCLKWNNHQSTIVAGFDTLLESGTLVDCTLAAEGQYLKAHKVVLSACSPYFELLLSQHDEKHPIVILKDVKFQELKAMVDYMYHGEVNISQDQLGALLKAAESLQIKGLSDSGGGGSERENVDKRHHGTRKQNIPPPQPRSSPIPPPHASTLAGHRRPAPPPPPQPPAAPPPIVDLPDDDSPSPSRPTPLPRVPSSREGSLSPPPKRKRHRRRSSGGEDGSLSSTPVIPLTEGTHETSSSSELPPQSQPTPTATVPSIPANITPVVPPSSEPASVPSSQTSEKPVTETEQLLNRAQAEVASPRQPPHEMVHETVLEPVQKVEPPSEPLLEPKSEYLEEDINEDSVEDLTLDDDMDEMVDHARPGPSHGGEGSSSQGGGFAPWHVADQSRDEVFMAAQEAVGAHRDSQDELPQQPVEENIKMEVPDSCNDVKIFENISFPQSSTDEIKPEVDIFCTAIEPRRIIVTLQHKTSLDSSDSKTSNDKERIDVNSRKPINSSHSESASNREKLNVNIVNSFSLSGHNVGGEQTPNVHNEDKSMKKVLFTRRTRSGQLPPAVRKVKRQLQVSQLKRKLKPDANETEKLKKVPECSNSQPLQAVSSSASVTTKPANTASYAFSLKRPVFIENPQSKQDSSTSTITVLPSFELSNRMPSVRTRSRASVGAVNIVESTLPSQNSEETNSPRLNSGRELGINLESGKVPPGKVPITRLKSSTAPPKRQLQCIAMPAQLQNLLSSVGSAEQFQGLLSAMSASGVFISPKNLAQSNVQNPAQERSSTETSKMLLKNKNSDISTSKTISKPVVVKKRSEMTVWEQLQLDKQSGSPGPVTMIIPPTGTVPTTQNPYGQISSENSYLQTVLPSSTGERFGSMQIPVSSSSFGQMNTLQIPYPAEPSASHLQTVFPSTSSGFQTILPSVAGSSQVFHYQTMITSSAGQLQAVMPPSGTPVQLHTIMPSGGQFEFVNTNIGESSNVTRPSNDKL